MVNIVRKCQAGQEWGDVEMGIGKWLSFGWVSILFWCHFQSVDKLVFICLFDICRVVPLLVAYASFAFDFLPDRVAFQATTYVAGHRSKRLDWFPRFRGFGTGIGNGSWIWFLSCMECCIKRLFCWNVHFYDLNITEAGSIIRKDDTLNYIDMFLTHSTLNMATLGWLDPSPLFPFLLEIAWIKSCE